MKASTDRIKVIHQILKSFSSVATNYGIEYEPITRREFREFLEKRLDICGFFVDEEEYYLGASPDRRILEENAIVEIKCPYNCRNSTIEEGVKERKLKFLEFQAGGLQLKKFHNYHYQVQGQLHITNTVVLLWFGRQKGFIYHKIKRDNNFFEKNMKEKLKTFYFSSYLPEIVKKL